MPAKTSQMNMADQARERTTSRRRSQYPGRVCKAMTSPTTKVAQKNKAIRKAKILKAVRLRAAIQDM